MSINYKPYVEPETKLVCKYNVTDTGSPISLYFLSSGSGSGSGSDSDSDSDSGNIPMFSSMIVDGGVEQEAADQYIFDTTGEHTVLFTLAEGITSIGDMAFQNCSELTSITIPDSVTSIGIEAFYSCSGLMNITCNATTAPTIQDWTFQSIKSDGILTVPVGSTGYDAWMSTDNYYLGKYNWTKVEQ